MSKRIISGYVKQTARGPVLTDWCGSVILACRSRESGASYSADDDGDNRITPMAFLLPGRRAIVGGSLGDGMLFRGELVEDADPLNVLDDAHRVAEELAESDLVDSRRLRPDSLSELLHALAGDTSWLDDQTGDVNFGSGWYGRIDGPIRLDALPDDISPDYLSDDDLDALVKSAGFILRVDSQGFRYATAYSDLDALQADWDELEAEDIGDPDAW